MKTRGVVMSVSEKTNHEKLSEKMEKVFQTSQLKIKLASMDAQDSWKRLENQLKVIGSNLKQFSVDMKHAKEEFALESKLALMEASDRFEEIEDEISHVYRDVCKKTRKAYDYGRLKSKLAKLEAKEFKENLKHKKDELNASAKIWSIKMEKLMEKIDRKINELD